MTKANEAEKAITVYGKPGCGQCAGVRKHLERHHLRNTYVDVTRDPDAVKELQGLGYQQVPVLVDAQGEHVAGFDPGWIAEREHDPAYRQPNQASAAASTASAATRLAKAAQTTLNKSMDMVVHY